MDSSMWLLGLMAIFVIDTRIGALPLKESEPRRCYECNGTACEDPEEFADDEMGKPVVVCPRDRPHCSTRAAAPNFVSVLTCNAASDTPCALVNPNKDTFEIVCVCSTHLCNAPFSQELRTELFHLRNSSQNDSEEANAFWRRSYDANRAVNTSEEYSYKTINVAVPFATGTSQDIRDSLLTTLNSIFLNTTTGHFDDYNGPRVQYLKHRTTLPSDDEEDDSEGSGFYEDPKYYSPTPFVPLAPTAYTPVVMENNAQPAFINILAAIPLLMYFVV